MEKQKNDPILTTLILTLLVLLTYAGILSYKSIQWDVLDKLEAHPLVLPPPASQSAVTGIPASASAHPK